MRQEHSNQTGATYCRLYALTADKLNAYVRATFAEDANTRNGFTRLEWHALPDSDERAAVAWKQ